MTEEKQLSSQKVVRLNSRLFPISPEEIAQYQQWGIDVEAIEAASPEEILSYAADCDGLVVVSAGLPAEVIAGMPKCRVISRLGVGVDRIDVEAVTENGIVLTNAPDFCVEEQADHTMALLLALVREVPQMHRAMLQGAWRDAREQCRSLHRLSGRTLGLVGFGRSARAVAQRAAGFGMRLLATRRNRSADDETVNRLGVKFVDLDRLLAESDYVSLHLPLSKETRHLLDGRRLSQMKPGAILINTSRGAIVDETALVESLQNGPLAAAGIDTFAQIDLHDQPASRPDHPLLNLDNILLTPHVAGLSHESCQDIVRTGIGNLAAVLSGSWPPQDNIVNPHVIPRTPLARPKND